MTNRVRFFSDSSLLALKYVDMLVELGLEVSVIPQGGFDFPTVLVPNIDEDGWTGRNEKGYPVTHRHAQSPWLRHRARLNVLQEMPVFNVCCGDTAAAERVWTAGVRNIWISEGYPDAPAGLDPARGYDAIVVDDATTFDAWDLLVSCDLVMVVPKFKGHLERLREAVTGVPATPAQEPA